MFYDFEKIDIEDKVLLTDSRFLSSPSKSIFFAIKGVRHDGHRFIRDLYSAGIRRFVVEESALTSELTQFLSSSDTYAYKVTNGVEALQRLASEKREKFNYPVVGITGSNGKTIVKEWLSSLLEMDFRTVKSPRSYNSQIGVPLSVWEMSARSNLGIFEAGISQPGEMQHLEKVIRPDLGIFTNIGTAHSDGFESKRQKIREKLLLFKHSKALIYCRDYAAVETEIESFLLPLNPEIELIPWSGLSVEKMGDLVEVEIAYGDFSERLVLPFSDNASIENAIHCAYAGLYLLRKEAKSVVDFFGRFRFLRPVEMRLELKEGREGNYIIDDSYNNDLGGLKGALNFMSQTHTLRNKIVILSDVFQSGLSEAELMSELFNLLGPQELTVFVGIGEVISRYRFDIPGTETFLFENTESFLESNLLESFQKSLILVKGARIFSFEKIVERLVKKIHGTVLEINLDAITHNLNFYRAKAGKNTLLMVMVKAFAYGSGDEVAAWLQYHRVDYLTVAYPDEGVALRQNGITLPIMVMNADPDSYSTLFEYDLEPEIYSFRVLKAFIKAQSRWKTDKRVGVHLKIDTGMHRLGFMEDEIDELLSILKENNDFEIKSIFSHLVGSEAEEFDDFTRKQIEKFKNISERIIAKIGYRPIRHICNTAAIERFPEARFDMVRLGIGLYGVSPWEKESENLQTVVTLKTTISQIKTLNAGETVGYDRRGILTRDSKIATIALGYADGYSRIFGRGTGSVLINGEKCKTIGSICMDMTMVDVSDVDCKEGDEVIVFGKDLRVEELAAQSNTIPYEILTGISLRVKRVFFRE